MAWACLSEELEEEFSSLVTFDRLAGGFYVENPRSKRARQAKTEAARWRYEAWAASRPVCLRCGVSLLFLRKKPTSGPFPRFCRSFCYSAWTAEKGISSWSRKEAKGSS
jgi:hypothetical protein